MSWTKDSLFATSAMPNGKTKKRLRQDRDSPSQASSESLSLSTLTQAVLHQQEDCNGSTNNNNNNNNNNNLLNGVTKSTETMHNDTTDYLCSLEQPANKAIRTTDTYNQLNYKPTRTATVKAHKLVSLNQQGHSATVSRTLHPSYSLVVSVEETHKKPIYSIAWSRDCYEYNDSVATAAEHDEQGSDNRNDTSNDNDKLEHGECVLEVEEFDIKSQRQFSDQGDVGMHASIKVHFQYLVTCAGPHVHLYRVHLYADTGHCQSVHLHQVYKDEVADHDLCCCTFAGGLAGQQSRLPMIPQQSTSSDRPAPCDSARGKDNGTEIANKKPRDKVSPKDPVYTSTDTLNQQTAASLPPTQPPDGKTPDTDHTNSQKPLKSGKNHNAHCTLRKPSHANNSIQFTDNPPLLMVVAGNKGIIRVIPVNKPASTTPFTTVMNLLGHGGPILDLKVSPTTPYILASASEDEGIRLWNLQSGTHVATLSGHDGHHDAVVSLSWHASGARRDGCLYQGVGFGSRD
jgi:WD domain, G-beta repeat